MTMNAMHVDPHPFPPLQLKGEIMDLEFTVDTDHRKRRRNRTTQSCLNCHTSKRKCDRKRPCQRCIQLGLTGLCVYEIDDPALRDDPSVDENTRLRNRIAELESLVRELRGKPHPRWADSNFRDGDPNEKWHSRATKCAPTHSTSASTSPVSPTAKRRAPSPHHALPPIKTEGPPDPAPHLYRFSPSPPAPRYPVSVPPRTVSAFDSPDSYGGGYPASPPAPYTPASSSYSDGSAHHYASDDYRSGYSPSPPHHSQAHGFCPCRASPALGHAYIGLSQSLQSALGAARQYAHHPPGTACVLFRRIADLASLMQSRGTDPTDPAGPAYNDAASATHSNGGSGSGTDSEVLTPLSAGSHYGGGGGSPAAQEWGALAAAGAAGYNPYFPMPPPGEHAIYGAHVIT
ncbi:hypothetical protein B0H10DRAFT_2013499 [Mycena sp. CBHHK59/15]|nr:hypothetical protein B0H10DRAFT_2013499 [Mycena sp. CBHHK59/15]